MYVRTLHGHSLTAQILGFYPLHKLYPLFQTLLVACRKRPIRYLTKQVDEIVNIRLILQGNTSNTGGNVRHYLYPCTHGRFAISFPPPLSNLKFRGLFAAQAFPNPQSLYIITYS